jgi:hypothetical protein
MNPSVDPPLQPPPANESMGKGAPVKVRGCDVTETPRMLASLASLNAMASKPEPAPGVSARVHSVDHISEVASSMCYVHRSEASCASRPPIVVDKAGDRSSSLPSHGSP